MFASFLTSRIGKKAALAVTALLPYALAVLLAVFLWWHRYQAGYDDGVAEITKAVQAERLRQIEANQSALEEAQRRLDEMRALADERRERIDELLQESLSDPNAARPSLSPDSVRRLNQIR